MMAADLALELPGGGYPILVRHEAVAECAARVAEIAGAASVIVISDETVWALHGPTLLGALGAVGVQAAPLTVPPGEAGEMAARVIAAPVTNRMSARRIDEKDMVRSPTSNPKKARLRSTSQSAVRTPQGASSATTARAKIARRRTPKPTIATWRPVFEIRSDRLDAPRATGAGAVTACRASSIQVIVSQITAITISAMMIW